MRRRMRGVPALGPELHPPLNAVETLNLIKQGKDAWNAWSAKNPDAEVVLSGEVINDYLKLSGFIFPGDTYFDHVSFEKAVWFDGAEFKGYADFNLCKFRRPASFSKAVFHGEAYFREIIFSDYVTFRGAVFHGGVDLIYAHFNLDSDFEGVHNALGMDFSNSYFGAPPVMRAISAPDRVDLTGVDITFKPPSSWIAKVAFWLTGQRTSDTDIVSRIRALRGISAKTLDADTERRLGHLERHAQLGVAWSSLENFRPISRWWTNLSEAVSGTLLMSLYRWSSKYGSSVVIPIAWMIIINSLLFLTNLKIVISYGIKPTVDIVRAVREMTVSNLLPFLSSSRTTYNYAMQQIFGESNTIPTFLQISVMFQGVLNLTLLFLVGLGLRNFFKYK